MECRHPISDRSGYWPIVKTVSVLVVALSSFTLMSVALAILIAPYSSLEYENGFDQDAALNLLLFSAASAVVSGAMGMIAAWHLDRQLSTKSRTYVARCDRLNSGL